jgi:diguanylate cyclase (GGDEF)-like protein
VDDRRGAPARATAAPPSASRPDLAANEDHLDRLDGLRRLPAAVVVAASVLVLAVVTVVDYSTGPDLQLLIFYLLPVLAMTWRFDLVVGETTAAAVVVIGAVANVLGPDGLSRLTTLWNGSARFVFLSLVVGLVNRQRSVLDQQRTLATVDPLTGALNRRAFYAACSREFARARRDLRPLSLVYLDVNGLKRVNDDEGHEAGDQLLVELVAIVRDTARTSDLVGRLGGDEFAVLLTDADLAAGSAFADRLREAMRTDGPRPLSSSMGVATTGEPPAEVETLVHAADALMYEAKRDDGGVRAKQVA